MTSQSRRTKFPADLAAVAETRAAILDYPSWNAYIKGLIRYDALVQGPHTITLPLVKQDAIDSRLLHALPARRPGSRQAPETTSNKSPHYTYHCHHAVFGVMRKRSTESLWKVRAFHHS